MVETACPSKVSMDSQELVGKMRPFSQITSSLYSETVQSSRGENHRYTGFVLEPVATMHFSDGKNISCCWTADAPYHLLSFSVRSLDDLGGPRRQMHDPKWKMREDHKELLSAEVPPFRLRLLLRFPA